MNLKTLLPVMLSVVDRLDDPAFVRVFLLHLSENSSAIARAFAKLRAREIILRYVNQRVGPESIEGLGAELLGELQGLLTAAVIRAMGTPREGT